MAVIGDDGEDLSTLAKLRRAADPLSTLKDLYTAYQGMNPDEPDPNRITPKTILTASDIGSDPEVLAARRQIADAQASGLIDSVSGGVGPAMGITKKTPGGFLHLLEEGENTIGKIRNSAKKELGLESLSAKPIQSERFSVRPSEKGYQVFDNLHQETVIYDTGKNHAKEVAAEWNETPEKSSFSNEGLSRITPTAEADVLSNKTLLNRFPTKTDINLRISKIDELLNGLEPSGSNYDLAAYQDLSNEKRSLKKLASENLPAHSPEDDEAARALFESDKKENVDKILQYKELPLGKRALKGFEDRVDEIGEMLNNPRHVGYKRDPNTREFLQAELDAIIEVLTSSERKARIKESGLKVVK
jgi:hypothetical protein